MVQLQPISILLVLRPANLYGFACCLSVLGGTAFCKHGLPRVCCRGVSIGADYLADPFPKAIFKIINSQRLGLRIALGDQRLIIISLYLGFGQCAVEDREVVNQAGIILSRFPICLANHEFTGGCDDAVQRHYFFCLDCCYLAVQIQGSGIFRHNNSNHLPLLEGTLMLNRFLPSIRIIPPLHGILPWGIHHANIVFIGVCIILIIPGCKPCPPCIAICFVI